MDEHRDKLRCPDCSKPLIRHSSKIQRVHPVARFFTTHWVKFIFTAYPILIVITVLGIYLWPSKNWVYIFSASLPLPPFISYFLLRCFPIYRVTECPFCGSYRELKLGYSIAKDEF